MNLVQRLASIREQTLDRLIRVGLVAITIGIVVVGIVYYLDQHAAAGPSLLDRRISTTEGAIRKQPNNVGLRLQLADIYRAANKSDKALEQYDAVLKVEPGQRSALLGRAEILTEQGNFAEATNAFKKVIGKTNGTEFAAVDPQLASAYYGLGSIALKQHRPKAAVIVLEKAVQVEQTDSDSLYLLGVATMQAGAPRRAIKPLRRAVLFVPTGWCDPYQRLSEVYSELNNKPFAEWASAMVDFCQKRKDDATRRLKALTSGPAAVDAMLGLGMIAEAGSDRTQAIRWYRQVLAADGANSTALTGLGRLGAAQRSRSQPPVPANHPST